MTGFEIVEVGPGEAGYPDRRWAVAADGVVPSHGRYASASAAGRYRARLVRALAAATEGSTGRCRKCEEPVTFREVRTRGATSTAGAAGEPVLRWCVDPPVRPGCSSTFSCRAGGHHLPDGIVVRL